MVIWQQFPEIPNNAGFNNEIRQRLGGNETYQR
jgi:hypothetical protein